MTKVPVFGKVLELHRKTVYCCLTKQFLQCHAVEKKKIILWTLLKAVSASCNEIIQDFLIFWVTKAIGLAHSQLFIMP